MSTRMPCCFTTHTHAAPAPTTPGHCTECDPTAPARSARHRAVRAALASVPPTDTTRAWYNDAAHLPAAEAHLLPLTGEHLGTVGTRAHFPNMRLARATELPPSEHAPNEARWLLTFHDQAGNEVVWFTSATAAWPADGWQGGFDATPKEHSVWQNKRQTVISRCKECSSAPSKHPSVQVPPQSS